jgi:phage shock protein E
MMTKQAGFLAMLLWVVPALADHGGPPAAGQPLVVDVRTSDEYRQGHVREAVNIPYDEIAQRIAAFAPDRDARIVLYCRSGRRAGIAEQTLHQLGYGQIENKGGLDDMRRDGYRTD